MSLRRQPTIRERSLQRWDSNKARLSPQKYNNNKLEDGKNYPKEIHKYRKVHGLDEFATLSQVFMASLEISLWIV